MNHEMEMTRVKTDIEGLRAMIRAGQRESFPHIVRQLVTTATYTGQLREELIAVNYAGACAITLPSFTKSARLDSYSYNLIVQDESGAAGANVITISSGSANIISPATTAALGAWAARSSLQLNTNYGIVELYFNGTNWVCTRAR